MQRSTRLQHLKQDSERLAAVARRDLTRTVPSCPGWIVADVVLHTGAVQRAQTAIVAERAQEPAGLRRAMLQSLPGLLEWFESSTLMGGRSDPNTVPVGLVDWFAEGASACLATLKATDPSTPVWSWSGDQTAQHYLRLLPIETAIHRWDVECAHGAPTSMDAELARDAVGHTFTVMAPFRRAAKAAPAGAGETLLFRESGGNGSWLVRFDPEPRLLEAGATYPSVTIRGSASDLMLFLWGRLPASRLEVQGDAGMLERYFQLVPPM